jgi:hypothetical protein
MRKITMDETNILSLLEALAKANINAMHAYNRALSEISDPVIHSRLTNFLNEYRDHMTDLSREILSRGGTVPNPSKGLKSRMVEAVTALHHKAAGLKGALQMLKIAEERITHLYSEAVPSIDSSPLRDALRRHLSSAKNHLEYFKINIQAL